MLGVPQRACFYLFALLALNPLAGAGEYCGLVVGDQPEYVVAPGGTLYIPVYYVPGEGDCNNSIFDPSQYPDFTITPLTCQEAANQESLFSYTNLGLEQLFTFASYGEGEPESAVSGLVGYLRVVASPEATATDFTFCTDDFEYLDLVCPEVTITISGLLPTTPTSPPCVPGTCPVELGGLAESRPFVDFYPLTPGVTRVEQGEAWQYYYFSSWNRDSAVLSAYDLEGVTIIEELSQGFSHGNSGFGHQIIHTFYGLAGGRYFQASTLESLLTRVALENEDYLFADEFLPVGGYTDIAAVRRYHCAESYSGLYGDIKHFAGITQASVWDENESLVIVQTGSQRAAFHKGDPYDYFGVSYGDTSYNRKSFRPSVEKSTPIAPEFPDACEGSCAQLAAAATPLEPLVLPQASAGHRYLIIDLGENPPFPPAFQTIARFIPDTAAGPRVERLIPLSYDVKLSMGQYLGALYGNDLQVVGTAQREQLGDAADAWSLLRAGIGSDPTAKLFPPSHLRLPLSDDGYLLQYAASNVPAEGRAWTEDEFGNTVPLDFLPALHIYNHAESVGSETVANFAEMDLNQDGMQSPGEILFQYPYLQLPFWPFPSIAARESVNFAEALRAASGRSTHDADDDENLSIGLSELLASIQIYAVGAYHCADTAEQGRARFLAGAASTKSCVPHMADNHNGSDYRFDLTELLRVVQLYNAGSYHDCLRSNGQTATEDGFCPEASPA